MVQTLGPCKRASANVAYEVLRSAAGLVMAVEQDGQHDLGDEACKTSCPHPKHAESEPYEPGGPG